jgi:hypothetical protein
MTRKETYATTGTRIRLRSFRGQDFGPEDALGRDLALVGYSRGVHMGSDLPSGKGVPVGDTVDLSIPSWTNTIGASELGAVWTDPEWDPLQPAFYYACVTEIPTPSWTAYDAVKFSLDLPDAIPLIIQERAYTSPIWYTP